MAHKRLILLLLVMGFILEGLQASAAGVPEPYGPAKVAARTEIWKDINSGIAGSATVAVSDNGKIIYAEGFGMADRERSLPVQSGTIFNIGSISKVFTATAIMLLVDDGQVKLDDPVAAYIPEFTMADPRYKEITVRMLLNHASGLPGTTGANNFGFKYHKEFFQQTLNNLSHSHLKHRPGAMAPYTNDGFTLAEIIVERVSGRKFVDLLAERVFKPLGMTHTGLSVGERPDQSAAVYYWPDTGKKEPLEVVSLIGAGGLSSTAEDLCRFQDSFSGTGTQILSPASLAEMRKGQPSAFCGKLKHSDIAFGLGWDMTDLPTYRAKGIQVLGKSGGTGRYNSMMFTVPAHRISVAVIETAESGNALQIALDTLDAILIEKGLLAPKTPVVSKPLTPQPIPPQYAAYEGYYIPFKKINFDFKKSEVTVQNMEVDKPTHSLQLFYNNGYFHDSAGKPYYFITVDGQEYCVAYLPALQVDMMAGQKLKTLEHPAKLKLDLNGKLWLLRSAQWFDGIQGTRGYVLKSRTIPDLPGYIDFGAIEKVESPDFAGMPVNNIRDLNELTLFEREGTTWARLSENLFSPAAKAPVFQGGTAIVTIASGDLNQWLKTGDGLILNFHQPDQSRVIVFSPEGESLFDSELDRGTVYAPEGSFIEFAGQAGTKFTVEGK